MKPKKTHQILRWLEAYSKEGLQNPWSERVSNITPNDEVDIGLYKDLSISLNWLKTVVDLKVSNVKGSIQNKFKPT